MTTNLGVKIFLILLFLYGTAFLAVRCWEIIKQKVGKNKNENR